MKEQANERSWVNNSESYFYKYKKLIRINSTETIK